MNILFHKKFSKQYRKLTRIQNAVDERLSLFSQDPFHPKLNNHALIGIYQGYRGINITGDYRAVYELIDKNVAHFVDLNNHNNLYE